jgi:hypothetical protein
MIYAQMVRYGVAEVELLERRRGVESFKWQAEGTPRQGRRALI